MYPKKDQMDFSDFVFPYGNLDPENDWVKLASLVPWDVAEDHYATYFGDTGHPAYPARMALGALIIKQTLGCSDRWVVKHVSENPYLQFFIGLKEYTSRCPFGASTMVDFRKRFSPEDIAAIIEAAVPTNKDQPDDDHDDHQDGGEPPSGGNSGTLIMDASCCPADIAFPQDFQVLNDCREKVEGVIDELCHDNELKKPRMYRENARKDFLNLSKCKKRTARKVRDGVRKQLQYLRRDLRYIADFVKQGVPLTQKQMDILNIVTTVYEQQRIMFEEKSHSIPNRVVSVSQPWVRPIVRGKARAATEFGAKLHISVVDGYARIEHLSFDAYNEASDFFKIVERYHETYGHYPERILADKIYRNHETLAFCKEHGIRLTGPALGRPKKDKQLAKAERKQEYQDICDRNIIEGAFGTGKTAYGLGRIMARLEDTSFCVIGVALLTMNLQKRLRSLLLFIWNHGFYGQIFQSSKLIWAVSPLVV